MSISDLLITLLFISILTLFAAPLGEFMARGHFMVVTRKGILGMTAMVFEF